jgi:hypothetical protein
MRCDHIRLHFRVTIVSFIRTQGKMCHSDKFPGFAEIQKNLKAKECHRQGIVHLCHLLIAEHNYWKVTLYHFNRSFEAQLCPPPLQFSSVFGAPPALASGEYLRVHGHGAPSKCHGSSGERPYLICSKLHELCHIQDGHQLGMLRSSYDDGCIAPGAYAVSRFADPSPFRRALAERR